MLDITETSMQSDLAFASYADLRVGRPDESALRDQGFTQIQALRFAETWKVVEQFNDAANVDGVNDFGIPITFSASNGLSLTIFENNETGKRYLAIRGTDDPVDVLTDFVDVAVFGNTKYQGQYLSMKAKVQEWQSKGKLPSTFTVSGHSLGGFLAAALSSDLGAAVTHAFLFNSPGFGGFSSLTGPINTYLQVIRLVAGTSIPNFDSAKFTNIRATAGLSLISGLGIQPSPPINIEIENQFGSGIIDPPAARNHSMQVLNESLALYELFGKLEPTIAPEVIGKIVRSVTSRNGFSLEDTLDGLRRLFLGDAAVAASQASKESRNAFYVNLYSLRESQEFAAHAGRVSVSSLSAVDPNVLIDLARDDISFRYAIKELLPFAITGAGAANLYEKFNTNGELDRYSELSEIGLSEQWLKARSTLLVAQIAYNDVDGNIDPRTIGARFEDRRLGIAFGPSQGAFSRYLFAPDVDAAPLIGSSAKDSLFGGAGGDTIAANGNDDYVEGGRGDDVIRGGPGNDDIHGGSDADELFGDEGNDQLWGEQGNDRLEGGKGNDHLHGGSGFDTYVYAEGDGADTITDSDGGGQLLYKGQTLTGGGRVSSNTYVDAHGVRYELSDRAGGAQSLVIDGRIIVENFQPGNLGIELNNVEVPASLAPQITAQRIYTQNPNDTSLPYPSDRFPLGADLDSYLKHWFVNLYGSEGSDSLSVLPTDSLAHFDAFYSRGGDDYLKIAVPYGGGIADMGKGNDFIDASQATDDGSNQGRLQLIGGSGDDYILGGGGGDIIYGDNYRATATARFNSVVAAGTFQFDDFFYNIANAFPQLMQERAPDAAQAAILATSGSMFFPGGPFAESASFGVPHHIWQYDGAAAMVRYLELEGWIFQNGIQSVMEYLVGVDASFDDFIDGGAGADTITGGNGADTLYGGAGNDDINGDGSNFDSALGPLAFMLGAPGDDFIDGGDGNDTIRDTGNSTLLGGAGADSIQWSSTADANETAFVDGGDGNDTITVFGAALVEGGAGDDTINAHGGSETIATVYGGNGNDRLTGDRAYVDGGDGDDTYDGVVGAIHDSTGNDTYDRVVGTIRDGAGNDTAVFDIPSPEGATTRFLACWQWPGGFLPAETYRVYREGVDLVLELTKASSPTTTTVIENWYSDPAAPVEQVSANWFDVILFEAPAPYPPVPVMGSSTAAAFAGSDLASWGTYQSGTDADDVLIGGDYTDRILGFEGNDVILTGAGDDLIAGGDGDDYLDGGVGNDAYYYALGQGNDVIADSAGFDDLRFGQGILSSDISIVTGADEVALNIAGSTIRISAAGGISVGGNLAIDRLVFADQSQVTLASMIDTAVTVQGGMAGESLVGNAESNLLTGGPGEDYLYGGAGDDSYLFSLGDGIDHIYDVPSQGEVNTIRFGPGITPDALTLGTGSLLIRVGSDGDAIHLGDVNPSDIFGMHDVDRLLFADGSELSYAQLLQRGLDLDGSSNADVIVGSSTVDRITGGAGNDVLAGGRGNDLYRYAAGDGLDTIIEPDEAGSTDVLRFGAGIEAASVTVARAGDELQIGVGAGGVILSGWYSNAPRSIERIEFLDGNSWTAEDLESRVIASPAPTPSGDVALPNGVSTAQANPLFGQSNVSPSTSRPLVDAGATTTDALRPVGSPLFALDRGSASASLRGDFESAIASPAEGELTGRTVRVASRSEETPLSGSRSGTSRADPAKQAIPLDLQTIEDAAREFESGVPHPRPDDSRQDLDSNKPADRPEEERGEITGISRWALTDALMHFHLSRADMDDSIGGLPTELGLGRILVGQELAGAPGFGSEAHTLRPFTGLDEGFSILS